MDDFFRLEVDAEAVSDRVRRAIDRFWGNESRFERVARRTRRNIIEGGESSNEIIIE